MQLNVEEFLELGEHS